MAVRAAAIALLAVLSLCLAQNAAAQAKPPLNDDALKEALVWNSPWSGRSTKPPALYSYRVIFRQRRDSLIAEVTSLSTNQRSDSVVTVRDGTVSWLDSGGAEVSVTMGASEELVGTARNAEQQMAIALKPRP